MNITASTFLLSVFLTVAFVVLRATNVVDWTVLWVVSPLWIWAAVGALMFVGSLVIGFVLFLIAFVISIFK